MSNSEFARIATWVVPAACALGGLLAGLLVRRFVLPVLARIAAKSTWKYDDALVEAIRGPVVLWFLLIGLRVAVRILPFQDKTDHAIGQAVLVLGIFAVTWAIAQFIVLAMRSTTIGLPGVSLIANLTRVFVFTIGALIILQTLGISIAPILTALGVGGLAVGLALQDTLSNFFAGIRILAAGKVRPGDFIKLESGEDGFVLDISWAQTTIRQLPNNVVIIPNAKLASAITTNYALPETAQAVLVQVGVSYASDLAKVEQVTIDVARSVLKDVPGAIADFEPFIRYHTFGDSSINFSVIMRATAHTERFLIVHEFVKRLHQRYEQEGIEIPFPQRVVTMKREA